MEFIVIGQTSYETRMFVERILQIMEKKGITRVALAKRLDLYPSQVTKILSGRENMTVRTMESLAEAVGYQLVFALRRLPS